VRWWRRDKELEDWYKNLSTGELWRERREESGYLIEIQRQLKGTSDMVPRGAIDAHYKVGRIRARKALAAIDRELKRRGAM
jgi:hypothetical protein